MMNTQTDIQQEILDQYAYEVEQAKEGSIDVFDVGTRLNETIKALSGLYDELKPEIQEKRERYPDKEEITCNGYEIKIGGRKYYKYDHDSEHSLLKDRIKAREKLMKRAANSMEELVDPVTQEVIPAAEVSEKTWPVLKYVGQK